MQVLAVAANWPGTVPETLGLITGIRSALPEHYWGNAVTNASPVMPAAELRSASLGSVAQAVRGGLASLTEQSVCDEIGFLTAQREAGRSRQVLSRMWLDAFAGTVAFNNVAQLPVYEIEFGSGKPFGTSTPPRPSPGRCISPRARPRTAAASWTSASPVAKLMPSANRTGRNASTPTHPPAPSDRPTSVRRGRPLPAAHGQPRGLDARASPEARGPAQGVRRPIPPRLKANSPVASVGR